MKFDFEMEYTCGPIFRQLTKTVDWPSVPRVGEFVEVLESLCLRKVDSVSYDRNGNAVVTLDSFVDPSPERRYTDRVLSDLGWEIEETE